MARRPVRLEGLAREVDPFLQEPERPLHWRLQGAVGGGG